MVVVVVFMVVEVIVLFADSGAADWCCCCVDCNGTSADIANWSSGLQFVFSIFSLAESAALTAAAELVVVMAAVAVSNAGDEVELGEREMGELATCGASGDSRSDDLLCGESLGFAPFLCFMLKWFTTRTRVDCSFDFLILAKQWGQ